MNFVIQDSLQKSGDLPGPTPTPLSLSQESFYEILAPNLISLAQANGLDAGEWALLRDEVGTDPPQICRIFENRTNADIRWVGFLNCIYRAEDTSFDNIIASFSSGKVQLESAYEYEGSFLLFGESDGHTFFDAWLHDGELIYLVSLESRTLIGETPEDIFSEIVDAFINEVLLINQGN